MDQYNTWMRGPCISPATRLFDGFSALDHQTSRIRFSGVVADEGPPVLLLHGYLQTHAAWHGVASDLAERYTILAPDLPGYGVSRMLDPGPWHKRAGGTELVAMMRALGHHCFAVIGHDRGARVGSGSRSTIRAIWAPTARWP